MSRIDTGVRFVLGVGIVTLVLGFVNPNNESAPSATIVDSFIALVVISASVSLLLRNLVKKIGAVPKAFEP